jgi:hypothetical protein
VVTVGAASVGAWAAFIPPRRAMAATDVAWTIAPAGLSFALSRFWTLAQAELMRLGPAIPLQDRVGVADFGVPSSQPRFHLLDLLAGTVSSHLVAHGRGSDPEDSGLLQAFSNEVDSNASSEGAYRTGEFYVGRYGRSLRLTGLDGSNDNALPRAIVVHGADYVSPAIVHRSGRLGLSEGCFAFSEDDAEAVMASLGQDRLLLAGRFHG